MVRPGAPALRDRRFLLPVAGAAAYIADLMIASSLPGFRDFYPADMALRSHIFRTWREVARRYGFVEYDGPPLESLELYTRKSGEEIVGQLYRFTDQGGREVALRPDDAHFRPHGRCPRGRTSEADQVVFAPTALPV